MTRLPASVDPKDIPAVRKKFGTNFRKARLAAGLTQEEVSQISELSQPYISEVERGVSNISLDNMEKLAATVNKPLWTMLQK